MYTAKDLMIAFIISLAVYINFHVYLWLTKKCQHEKIKVNADQKLMLGMKKKLKPTYFILKLCYYFISVLAEVWV